ncbi:MAG: hypothetical protein LBM70_01430 [Victivallales bacterium]|nr:hypothetical protein [Victivallales bacterium]
MRAIINPYNHQTKWCEEFFPDRSICSLPVAGKTFAEHQIDSVSVLGVDEILLLDYNYSVFLQELLGSGERWSLKLKYLGSGIRRIPSRLLAEYSAFAGSDEVLVVLGPILPEFTSMEALLAEAIPVNQTEKPKDGVYLRRKDGELCHCRVPQRRMRSLREYFELNFQLLRTPRSYVLPGYRAENGVHAGMNVTIMQGCEISPPVVLGDNICLERECRLEDGVIVGNDVIIDRGNILRRCVVFDHTYIGKRMEFVNKIVCSGRIIDPVNEVSIDLEESGITSDMNSGIGRIDWMEMFESTLALILAVFCFVPYLFMWLPIRILHSRRWFLKLSMDRYPVLWAAAFRRASLINTGRRNERGVFRYSDAISVRRDKLQQKLDDRYFQHHRTPLLIVKTLGKAFINRIFMTDDMVQNT